MKAFHPTRHRLIAFIALAAAISVFLFLQGSRRRRANTLEFAYSYLAAELRMPELCEKISPGAFLAASFSSPGHQVSYTRSECYFNVAVEMELPELCRQVRRPRFFFLLDGSENSEERCREGGAGRRQSHPSAGAQDWTLRFMGNTGENIAEQEGDRPKGAHGRKSIPDQARDLPDFSRSDGRVVIGASYESLGCSGVDDPDWACFAYRCLLRRSERVREACLELATFVKTRQESEGDPRPVKMSGWHQSLLKKYPEIRLPE